MSNLLSGLRPRLKPVDYLLYGLVAPTAIQVLNQVAKRIDLSELIHQILLSWREFFRVLWSDIFQLLRQLLLVDISAAENQLDGITLNFLLLGIVASRVSTRLLRRQRLLEFQHRTHVGLVGYCLSAAVLVCFFVVPSSATVDRYATTTITLGLVFYVLLALIFWRSYFAMIGSASLRKFGVEYRAPPEQQTAILNLFATVAVVVVFGSLVTYCINIFSPYGDGLGPNTQNDTWVPITLNESFDYRSSETLGYLITAAFLTLFTSTLVLDRDSIRRVLTLSVIAFLVDRVVMAVSPIVNYLLNALERASGS